RNGPCKTFSFFIADVPNDVGRPAISLPANEDRLVLEHPALHPQRPAADSRPILPLPAQLVHVDDARPETI
ncbi:MAG: hypothetical protein ACMG6E_07530, partial [Candidatus Roizmanbacteria bacterium]